MQGEGVIGVDEKQKAYVLRQVEERDVRFVRLWFTDVLGFLKSFSIPTEELEGAFEEGVGFDGSAIQGMARVQEADMIACPDPTTFQILPWRPESQGVARMYCDIASPDGTPFEGDPRWVLRRVLGKAREMGFTFYCGPEMEFFLFSNSEQPDPLDQGTYFDLTPQDIGSEFRRRAIHYSEQLGISVHTSHHEVASSQHEIDLRFADALTMADNIMTFRLVVKQVAQEHGIYATFMPKPIQGQWGSGMHTHLSLFEGDRNAFFDATDDYHLSKVAKSFTAGILTHAREMTAVTNQWVNSYKRLIPGYEAPVFVVWGRRNRSALVRVPMAKPHKEQSTRIEYRAPDPACNPYLYFAVVLAAGLKGIEENYELPPEAQDDIYSLAPEERRALGIKALPDTLEDALELMERSELMAEALGEHVFEWFLRNKRDEWEEYKAYVTPFELQRYLPML
ncbi:MAG TPA: glutamine synthetase family protein [Actinomycetota bacterium]|nr:glutamine synthetase family protein [Actinomycetota bacterium]